MAKKQSPAVYKIIELVGTSGTSWSDAAKNGVKAAGATLRDLRVAEIDRMDVKVESGKLLYRVKMKVSFKYHGND